jgi:hypothetical protein
LPLRGTTEVEISAEGDIVSVGHVSKTIFTSISKGSNGLWNGYVTIKESADGHEFSGKQEFKNLDAANGCGEYISWEGDEKDSEFTITMDGTSIHVKGFGHDDSGVKIEVDKTI